MKKDYYIKVEGCDDFTQIEVALSATEVKLLLWIAGEINEVSHSNCEPSMAMWLVGEPEPERHDEDDDGGVA